MPQTLSMDLFFREEGRNNKETVVIIHGLYGSSDNWLTIGKKLGLTHHVYMVDHRNHGRSPKSDKHSYELMKEDLASFFEKQNISTATVIGHSMGGKVAMYFAAEYPEKVNKLAVVDIAPKDYFQLQEKSQYFLHKNILESLIETQLADFTSREEIAEALSLKIDGYALVQFLLKNIYRDKETKQFKCRINAEVIYDALDEIISGVNYRWFEDRLPIFNYPVLFIKGENSNYIIDEDFPKIKKIYPEAKLETVPNAGHWLHAEQPQLFMEALKKFV